MQFQAPITTPLLRKSDTIQILVYTNPAILCLSEDLQETSASFLATLFLIPKQVLSQKHRTQKSMYFILHKIRKKNLIEIVSAVKK